MKMILSLVPAVMLFVATSLRGGHAFPMGSQLAGTSCGTYAVASVHGTAFGAANNGEKVTVTDAAGNAVTTYVPGTTYTVTASSGTAFRGFLIGTDGGAIAPITANSVLLQCGGGITWVAQTQTTTVTSVSAKWTAPAGNAAVTLGTAFAYNKAVGGVTLVKNAPMAASAAAVTAATAATKPAATAATVATKPTTTIKGQVPATVATTVAPAATAAPVVATAAPVVADPNAAAGATTVAPADPNAGATPAANLNNAGTNLNNNALNGGLMQAMGSIPPEVVAAVAIVGVAFVVLTSYIVMKRRAAAAAAAAAVGRV